MTSPLDCPIDRGVDVALVARPRVAPHPTPLETGVSCALHAGLPLVEKGTAACDPFEPWLARRVGEESVVETCEEAVQTAWASLRERIERRGMDIVAGTTWAGPIGCTFERDGDHLRVRLSGPPLDKDDVHTLSVRVLDAVRADGRRYAGIDVSYAPSSPTRVS